MFKLFLINFVKFIYLTHIYEDFSIYTKFGKIFIYPTWMLKNLYVIVLSPIFLLEYWWINSKTFKMIENIVKM